MPSFCEVWWPDHKQELQRVQKYSAVFIHSLQLCLSKLIDNIIVCIFIDNASKDKFPTFQFILLFLNL